MLVKSDIRYIIKRVIIGVLIALILSFISGIAKADTFEYSPALAYYQNPNTSGWLGIGKTLKSINGQDYYVSNTAYEIPKTALLYEYGLPANTEGVLSFILYYNGELVQPPTARGYYNGNTFTCESIVPSYNGTNKYFITYYCPNYKAGNGYNSLIFSLSGPNNGPAYVGEWGISNFVVVNGTSNNAISEVNNSINNVNNSINNSTPVSDSDVSGNASDWASNNSDSPVINQLVLMPVTLLNAFVNGLSSTCSTYSFGTLFDTELTLPCINMSQKLGVVWTTIDVILSGVFIFIFGKRCVKIFNDFTNLRSGQIDSLYGGDN